MSAGLQTIFQAMDSATWPKRRSVRSTSAWLGNVNAVRAPPLRLRSAYTLGAGPNGHLEGRAQVTSGASPVLLGYGARAVAAARVVIGLTALAWPSVPARPWVGAAADDLPARVFGRALGARDLALGLGALTALQRPGSERGSARAWVAAGALSDALDVVASLSSWRELPRRGRWLVIASASGAALTGAAGALAARPGPTGTSS